MGWADLIGGGFGDYVASNRGKLGQIAAGLGTGQNFSAGLSQAAQNLPQGQAADDAYASGIKADAERQKQLNSTIEFMRQKGYDDLVNGVEGGGLDIGTAWGEALKRGTPGYGQAEPLKPTSSMQEYQFAQGQGYTGTFQQYETDMKKAGATSIDFNQNQGVAAGFADRMAAANSILDDPKLTDAQTNVVQQGLGGVPGVGNFLTSSEKQMADQAQRDFVNAILRRESGAAIAPSEFDNAAKQYFPQPGDSPEVIKQKAANRKIAIQGVTRAAGPAYQAPPAMGAGGVVDFSTYFGGQ